MNKGILVKKVLLVFISFLTWHMLLIEAAKGIDISGCSVLDTAGATYLLNTSITDSSATACMNISANNVTLDCQGHTIDGDDVADYGIYVSRSVATTTNITIKNCTLSDWNTTNIYLQNASENTLKNITSESSPGYGFYLDYSNNNLIENVTAKYNYYGLYIRNSKYNRIENSTLVDNNASVSSVDFYLYADFDEYCNNKLTNIVGSGGLPIEFYNTSSTTISDKELSELFLCNVDNSLIKNITIKNVTAKTQLNNGIFIRRTENSNFTDLNVSYTAFGIYPGVVNNLRIENSTLEDNGRMGLALYYVNNSIFKNLTFRNNCHTDDEGSILVYDEVYNNSFENITILGTIDAQAILLEYDVVNNSFDNLNLETNYTAGWCRGATFCLYSSGVKNNTIKNSKVKGYRVLDMENSPSGNIFYNNLFNASTHPPIYWLGEIGVNYWNTTRQAGDRIYSLGTEIGGNYWTNSTGNGYSDTCTDANKDGFCDSGYILDPGQTGNNTDYLPLSDEYVAGWPPLTITWESPTPANATATSNDWVYLNTTITDASNTSAFFDWNYSLVGYWAMDWYNSTGVFDNSSYNNFGTFYGGLGTDNITTGKYGKALSFDGSNDYISVPPSTSLNITNAITLEAWIKADNWAPSDYDSPFITKANGTDWGVWNLVHKVNDNQTGKTGFRFEIVISGTRYKIWSTTQGQTNQWYHLVGTFDGTTMRLYVNGIEENSNVTPGSIDTNNLNLQIGKQWWYYSNYSWFNGTIDEVRIYNRALSPEEINASYNNGLYRLYHNFTSLSPGKYDYYAYAIDTEGNANKTGIRTITVQYTTPPTYSLNSTNSTLAGTAVSHNLYWQDNVGLSYAIFSFDNCTGSLQNISEMSLSGNSAWSNFTVVINSTVGCTIRWCVYANDTNNNWNGTSCQNPFTYTSSSVSSTLELNATKVWWNDSVLASGYMTRNGQPANGTLNLFIGSQAYCSNVQVINGNWNCTFYAPSEIKSYTVTANYTDDLGNPGSNTTALTVSPFYGKRPTRGTISIIEQYVMIQDLNGRIKRVKLLLAVWR